MILLFAFADNPDCVKLTNDNNQHAYINGNLHRTLKLIFHILPWHFLTFLQLYFTLICTPFVSCPKNRMGGSHAHACNFKSTLRIGEKSFGICLSLAYFTYHNDFPTPPILLQTPHFSLCMYTSSSLSIHLLVGIPSISQLVWSVQQQSG